MLSKAVRKYLARYASPHVEHANQVRRRFAHVVVVPVRDESPAFVEGLWPALGDATLLVVVINHARDSPARVIEQNHEIARALAGDPRALVVELALEPREGVGRARRVGCDIALALYAQEKLTCDWIFTTDADVVLPADYLTAARAAPMDAAALTYPFWHARSGEELLDRATALYEIALAYYVCGLAWARSPYAFFTVGSTLAVRAEIYAAVRGVPARQAGEDFYLLNKVAKLGKIVRPAAAPITIASRYSERVPFGTGPAAARFARLLAAGLPPRLYHPHTFARLRDHLRTLGDGARVKEQFDALATLKCIHAARRAGLADVPWYEALAAAPFSPYAGRALTPDTPLDELDTVRRAFGQG